MPVIARFYGTVIKMNRIPKVKHVQAKDNFHLIIKFENNLEKDYDCQQIIYRLEFKPLLNKAFFRSVKVDIGGYGISWNDDIDISEYELWTNGKNLEDNSK